MGMPTLLDVLKTNGNDAVVGLIDEAARVVPEVSGINPLTGAGLPGVASARTIRGLNYKTLVRTAVPSVGFRKVNAGTAVDKSTFEQRLIECYLMNPIFECDKAIADVHEDGWQAYLAMEASGIMEGAFQSLGKAFFYGSNATHGLTDAFPGLLQAYDDTNMVVDAGGTTATTGSSVWLVRFGPQHVQWLLGNGGSLNVSEVTEVRLTDGSSNPYTAYHQELYVRPGLQVGSVYSVCRIKKLTADSGKGLTDALIYSALAKFPTGVRPDVMFCSRRSLHQLRNSRTATNQTGAPAPIPTEVEGIPIVPTDSLSDIEALTL